MKKNLVTIALSTLLIVSMSTIIYLINENKALEGKLIIQKSEAKSEIKKPAVAKPAPTLPSADEILTSLFPEIAALEETTKQNEADETKSKKAYLVISPEVFNFGTVKKSDGIVKAIYSLENKGDKVITLSYSFASCGCTTSSLKEDVDLAPGAKLPLEVSFDPNFYGPSFELGDITKNVTVLSNDPVKPFYKLGLKAHVIP